MDLTNQYEKKTKAVAYVRISTEHQKYPLQLKIKYFRINAHLEEDVTMAKKLNEEYIRVAAYYIWEQAGRPDGREEEFWKQACEQLMKAADKICSKKANKPAAKKLTPAIKTVQIAVKKPAPAPAKKAKIIVKKTVKK